MIVLNEGAGPNDGVAKAVAALVEAAKASPAPYTPEDLQEMLAEGVLLSEGVASWIRKKASGIDPELFPEIEKKFAGGLTPEEKESSIRKLSKAIVKATARIEKVEAMERDDAANPDPGDRMDQKTYDEWKKAARDHIAKAKALKARLMRAP